jgi:hypothetical protein
MRMNIHLDVEVAKIKDKYRKKFYPNRQGIEETDEEVNNLIEEIDDLAELSISKCDEKLNYYLDHWPDAIIKLKATEKKFRQNFPKHHFENNYYLFYSLLGVAKILKEIKLDLFVEKSSDLPSKQIDLTQNRTKELIAENFEGMDKKGWKYAFMTEREYNFFADLLTNFFEQKDYSVPEKSIKLKRSCKTKVAKVLGEIHAELSETPLRSDTEYFRIAKVLNHFKDVSDTDLVKAMQR